MKYIILLSILLMGCLSHNILPFHYIQSGGYSSIPLKIINIYVDRDFGEMDRIAIDNAIMQWNYALNGYVRIEIKSFDFDVSNRIEDGWVFIKIMSNNKIMVPDRKDGMVTLAFVNSIGGDRMFIIRDRVLNVNMLGVVLHEMGHLLGAMHDDAYLMQPQFNWEDCRCVDYAALKEVAAYQHLPMERLNYCVYGANIN